MKLPVPVIMKLSGTRTYLYAEDLFTILDYFESGEIGFALKETRRHACHSYKRVILREKWGWVRTNCIEELR